MLRRLVLLTLFVSLSGCSLMQRMRQSAAQSSANAEAGQLPVKLLRAPADWGELTRDAAFRMSQRASQVKELAQRPVFVSEPTQATPFALALRQFLQSNLTEMGLTVAQKKSDGALILDTDVQSVRMDSGMQIVVTTGIGNGSRYLFRATEVYAVNQADVKLYDASFLPAPPPPPAPPTPVKRINVTGDK